MDLVLQLLIFSIALNLKIANNFDLIKDHSSGPLDAQDSANKGETLLFDHMKKVNSVKDKKLPFALMYQFGNCSYP